MREIGISQQPFTMETFPTIHSQQTGFVSCRLSPTAVQRSGSSSEPLSSLQYYSVECTGLERRLVDCTWTIRTVKSSKRDAIALCKKGMGFVVSN